MTDSVAEAISEAAQRVGVTVGVAESLTGGMLSASLAAAPGAARWFRGGIVAYSPEVKQDLLGVTPGPVVSERCAAEMAGGAAKALGADFTVSVTGVGGPEPEEGQPPGTVWMAVSGAGELGTHHRRFDGGPADVCRAAAEAALQLLLDRLERSPGSNSTAS